MQSWNRAPTRFLEKKKVTTFHTIYISNLLSPLQSKAKYIWIYCNLASTFKSDDSFSSTDDLEQKQTKRKLSQKVKVRRPLIVAFIWLLIAGQQPGVFASLDKTSPKTTGSSCVKSKSHSSWSCFSHSPPTSLSPTLLKTPPLVHSPQGRIA